MDNAFRYTAKKGIELESDYPYKAKEHVLCDYKEKDVKFKNKGHLDVRPHEQDYLIAAIA